MLQLLLALALGLSSFGATDGLRSDEWIDFELYRDTRIYVPLTINGYETVGVLDSGAGTTTIDVALAEAAGIVGSAGGRAMGTGGTVNVEIGRGITMTVGDVTLSNMRVGIIDLSGVADRLLGRPLPVVIGREWFDAHIVDIDFPNRRLAFRDRDAWTYEGPGTTLPLIPNGPGRLVEIRVEGGAPIRAGFDIGQGSPLTILKPHADATNLLDGRPNGTVLAGGVGGSTTERITTVESLEVAGYRFEDVPAIVPTVAVGAFNTTRMQANLGTGIYGRFRMIVDFSGNRAILEPGPDAIGRPFTRNRAGLQFSRTSRGLEIAHVSVGSPAAAVGLEVGDVLTAVDGQPVGDGYWTGDMWRWTARPAGTMVEIAMASGRRLSLTLADFY